MEQKNVGLHSYSHFTHVMVTSYECNYAMSVSAKVSFDFGELTQRMKALLICQYKRGYALQPSRGALSKFTYMLNNELSNRCIHMDPFWENTYIGSEYISIDTANTEFIQWLEVTALLMNVSSLISIKIKGSYSTFHAFPRREQLPVDLLNLRKFAALVHQYVGQHKSELDFVFSDEAVEEATRIITYGESITHEYEHSY